MTALPKSKISGKHFVAHQSLRIQPDALTLHVSAGKPYVLSVPLPEGVIEHGRIADKALFDEALAKLFAKPLPYQSLVLCVPEHQVVIRSTILQQSASHDIHDAVLWQLQGFLPLGMDQMQIDWQVFDSDPPITVQVVAMPRQVLLEYVEALKIYSVTIVSVETPSMTLLRIGEDVEYPCILIDAEPTATIVVLEKPQLVYVTSVSPLQTLPARIADIKKYYAQKMKAEISHVYMTGTQAATLEKTLGTEAQVITLHGQSSAQLISYLLAEKPVTPPTDVHSLNLLPSLFHGDYSRGSDTQQARLLLKLNGWIVLLFNFLLLGILGFTWWSSRQSMNYEAAIPQGPNMAALGRLQSQVSTLNTYGAVRRVPSQVLRELLRLTDSTVQLYGIKISPENKSIVINGTAESATLILQYKDTLAESDLFTNIKLPLNIFEKKAPIPFTMTISWSTDKE